MQQLTNKQSSEIAAIDAEKLMLRNNLVVKSQEIVKLMTELKQAYGLIHKLKKKTPSFSITGT